MKTNNSKEKVRQLQNKLYLTAKKCDSRRFHALYDKVYRDDVLFEAWKRVKANKGSSGVDGIGIEDIEEMGIEKYLSEIKSELMDGKYKPSPVKRVMIPKPDGSERPLGIPTVKDRIVQMAAKIAIEPVFEADFRDCSYGFRPKRSARQALEVVRKACNNKGYYVVDADIEKFFDNVNQDKLMKLAEQRISDRRILKLIRQWFKELRPLLNRKFVISRINDKTMVSIRSIIRKCTDNFRTGNKPRFSYISVIGKHLLKYTGQTVGKVWTYSRYSCKVRR